MPTHDYNPLEQIQGFETYNKFLNSENHRLKSQIEMLKREAQAYKDEHDELAEIFCANGYGDSFDGHPALVRYLFGQINSLKASS